MLTQLINNSYSLLQNASRWYWSESTQSTLSELSVITVLMLSQMLADYCGLLNNWLTPGCDNEVLVITTQIVEFDVWTELLVDLTYAATWLGFTLGDIRAILTEYYYRLRTVLL